MKKLSQEAKSSTSTDISKRQTAQNGIKMQTYQQKEINSYGIDFMKMKQ